jgi:DUF1707 SHOCT-like domain/Cell wall-active antibiotics response LiaF, C-terminal
VVEPSHRVSDDDRERTIRTLRANLVEGRLTLDEFANRAELAYRAQIGAELSEVTHDLPEAVTRSAPTPGRASRLTLGVFAHVVRSGRLRLRRRTMAVSLFADVDLDLRQAEIQAQRTTVTVLAVFGNIDVYVPAGINVDVGGLTVFGHRRTWGRLTGPPSAPALYVRALSLFGTVDVWHVPSETNGTYGEIIRQLKQQQRQLEP